MERAGPPEALPGFGLRRSATGLIDVVNEALTDAGLKGPHLPHRTRPISSANAVKTKSISVQVELQEEALPKSILDSGGRIRVWIDDRSPDFSVMYGTDRVGKVVDVDHSRLRDRPLRTSWRGLRFVPDAELRKKADGWKCKVRVWKR